MYLNAKICLKENFLRNALDGSDDWLVEDSLWNLVKDDILPFRQQEMTEPLDSVVRRGPGPG